MVGDEEIDGARRRDRDEKREQADRLYAGDWMGGRLLGHGRAPYRFEPEAQESYYVRLQTAQGRQVLWGTDLERAIRESKSHAKVGDAVGVRIVSREKLENGRTWNRWQVDQAIHIVKERRTARQILEDPITARRAAKDGATLTGSYLLVTAAEMLARAQFPDEQDQKRFVDRIRAAAAMQPAPERPPEVGRSHDESAPGSPIRASPVATQKRDGFARE